MTHLRNLKMKKYSNKLVINHWLITTCIVVCGLLNFAQADSVVYIHTDMLGSPTAETDEEGNVISLSHYEPFGKRLEGNKEGLGYTGHLEDTDLELTYMQARYYDPMIGRFYSNDPVGSRDVHSFNRYAYANNNPYKYVDPDGRETNPVSGTNFIKDSQLRTNSSNPKVGQFGKTRTNSSGAPKSHQGVDIKASNGTPLVAPISGTATVLKNSKKGGNVIWVTGKNGADKVKIGMAHLDSVSIKNGDKVQEGDSIGTAGSTGNAKGMSKSEEHVHLSVRVNGKLTDPQQHFKNNPKKTKP